MTLPRRWPHGRRRVPPAVWLIAFLALTPVPPAFAGTEQFSTFDVEAQEEDDESLLDHLLTRPPRAWRDEWEHSTQAVRTSQGCLTSGQWFIDTQLKLSAPLGERARLVPWRPNGIAPDRGPRPRTWRRRDARPR